MVITLAKALKEKNKVVGRIKELESKIYQHNVTVKGNIFVYNAEDLLSSLVEEKSKLIILKNEIFKANLPIYKNILNLSECKSHLKFLKGLNVQEGIVFERYGSDKEINYVSQIGITKKDSLLEKEQSKVDALQEEIDVFNHSTSIEIDL